MSAIGVFLVFDSRIASLDAQGIGRFTVRLAEGILADKRGLFVQVLTDTMNAANVALLFQRLQDTYPNRLNIRTCDPIRSERCMEWVNQSIVVDAWIVPYMGLKLACNLKQPYILCLHDLVHKQFRDLYSTRFPEYFNNLDATMQSLIQRASSVVVSSSFTLARGAMSLDLPPEKMSLVRLAAPTEEYMDTGILNESFFRARYNLPEQYIVYPSAIRLHKNHVRLMQAFLNFVESEDGAYNPLSLVLTDHYMNSLLKSEISTLLSRYKDSSRNRIVFLRRIPSSDLPSLYRYAIGTVVPTLFEGSFPFQILESMIMETPVAFSELEVIRELLPSTKAFISYDPYSVDEIEAAIMQLYKSSDIAIRRQQASASQILTRTWSDVATEYLRLMPI